MDRSSLIYALLSCLLLPQLSAEDVPFGTLLGSSHGVDGFSNSNSSLISEEDHFLDGVFTGMKWQCVEYARRYLYLTKGLTFANVEAAINIWDLPTVTEVNSERNFELIRHPNGQSPSPPKEGDLMIWPRQGTDTPFGHVAVVVFVRYDLQGFDVQLAEQNFLNEKWEAPDSHARSIRGTLTGQTYSVTDPGYQITGWLSVGNPAQTPQAAPRGWDTTMLGLLALPVFITVAGVAVLAYKRHKEHGSGRRQDGHLLLDEEQVISTPLHQRKLGEFHAGLTTPQEVEVELENIR